jgi:hypothetical protein
MALRLGAPLLALTLGCPSVGALAVLQGCSSRAAMTPQDPVEQGSGDHHEQMRDRRFPKFQRKVYVEDIADLEDRNHPSATLAVHEVQGCSD